MPRTAQHFALLAIALLSLTATARGQSDFQLPSLSVSYTHLTLPTNREV